MKLPRWKDGEAGQLPEVDSVAGVWGIADWHERETYDLMGIRFFGHPESAADPVPRGLGRPSAPQRLRNAAGIPRNPRPITFRMESVA